VNVEHILGFLIYQYRYVLPGSGVSKTNADGSWIWNCYNKLVRLHILLQMLKLML